MPIPFSYVGEILLLSRSVYGAYVCAATAGNALVRIDLILAVALGDAANRAAICASTARNALIGNLISHREKPPKKLFPHIF